MGGFAGLLLSILLLAAVPGAAQEGGSGTITSSSQEGRSEALVSTPTPVTPPVLSSPTEVVKQAADNIPDSATFFPPALFPWALAWVLLAFFIVAVFLQWNLRDEAERVGLRNTHSAPEWRLTGIFTTALGAMTIMQIGYAAYASVAFFKILGRISAFPWIIFLFGFLPLPILLVEALCAIRHPRLGMTRHYYNNVRLAEGGYRWMAIALAWIEARHHELERQRILGGWFWRSGLTLMRIFLIYVIATLLLLHIRRPTTRQLFSKFYRVIVQMLIDANVLIALTLGLLAFSVGVAGGDPETGQMLLGSRVTWTGVMYGYLYLLAMSVVLTFMLTKSTDQSENFTSDWSRWLAVMAVFVVLTLLAADVWISTLPLPQELIGWEELPPLSTYEGFVRHVGWLTTRVRLLVGGWAPPGFLVATLVMAIAHQKGAGRIWQQLGINTGQRLPFGFMLKIRHRGLNLLSPIKLALTEAQRLADGKPTNPAMVSDLTGTARASCSKMEYWFDDIRRGGEALNWAFQTATEDEPAPLGTILDEVIQATRAFVSAENMSEKVPSEAICAVVPSDVATVLLDVNVPALQDCLLNLTHNACEAIYAQHDRALGTGRVTILAKSADDPLFPWEIMVEDNGPGIPIAWRTRVFEPLFSHGKEKGTGMGLYQAQAFARALGSDIHIRNSTPGRCCIALPIPIDITVQSPHSKSGP